MYNSILRQYGSEEIFQIYSQEGYPLVVKCISEKNHFVIKYLPYGDAKVKTLKEVYHLLNDSQYYCSPIINLNGEYITRTREKEYIVMEELQSVENYPTEMWWGMAMADIHNRKISEVVRYENNQIFEYKNIWEDAKRGMDFDTVFNLERLLVALPEKPVVKEVVLNHGDPLFSNILKKDDRYVFIDIENCILAPREYDIQRHLWDYVFWISDADTYLKHWQELQLVYEKNSKKINREMLIYLYIIDICRTISWLSLVSKNKSRKDYERQLNDYIMLKNALNTGRLQTMFEVIREN